MPVSNRRHREALYALEDERLQRRQVAEESIQLAAKLRAEIANLKRVKKWNVRVGGLSLDYDTESEAETAADTIRKRIAATSTGPVEIRHGSNTHYVTVEDVRSILVAFDPPKPAMTPVGWESTSSMFRGTFF